MNMERREIPSVVLLSRPLSMTLPAAQGRNTLDAMPDLLGGTSGGGLATTLAARGGDGTGG